MALIAVTSVENGAAVLSLDVDATNMVVGYQLVTSIPVRVDLDRGAVTWHQTLQPGTYTGTIPKNRQWDMDSDSGVSYSISSV